MKRQRENRTDWCRQVPITHTKHPLAQTCIFCSLRQKHVYMFPLTAHDLRRPVASFLIFVPGHTKIIRVIKKTTAIDNRQRVVTLLWRSFVHVIQYEESLCGLSPWNSPTVPFLAQFLVVIKLFDDLQKVIVTNMQKHQENLKVGKYVFSVKPAGRV